MRDYFRKAIFAVHDEIVKLHDELEKEHWELKPNIFGRPRKRHHQIMGASKALCDLGQRINKLTREDVV